MARPKWTVTLDNASSVVTYVGSRIEEYNMPWNGDYDTGEAAKTGWEKISRLLTYCDVESYRNWAANHPDPSDEKLEKNRWSFQCHTHDVEDVAAWLTKYADEAFIRKMRNAIRQGQAKRNQGYDRTRQISLKSGTLADLNHWKGDLTHDQALSKLLKMANQMSLKNTKALNGNY